MKKLLLLGTTLLLVSFASAQNNNSALMLSRPSQDAIIVNNMPELTWLPLEDYSFEVWIDGIRMASDIIENWFIPFPLSYGKHQWKVVATGKQGMLTSKTATFTIEGAPLSPLPENAFLLRNDWKVISSLLAGNDGASLSKKELKRTEWKSTSLPFSFAKSEMSNLKKRSIPSTSDVSASNSPLIQTSAL